MIPSVGFFRNFGGIIRTICAVLQCAAVGAACADQFLCLTGIDKTIGSWSFDDGGDFFAGIGAAAGDRAAATDRTVVGNRTAVHNRTSIIQRNFTIISQSDT